VGGYSLSAGLKPRALVLVLQFCTAYPHFHSNGSAMKRERSPQPSRMCCNPLAITLSYRSAPALHTLLPGCGRH
jgi:hypothetical protein